MQCNRSKKWVIGIAVFAIIGLAVTAFADWGRGGGRGFGPGACGGPGSGYNCPAALDALNDEQIDRLNEMRTRFFVDTRDLKDRMYQKGLELRSELAKQDPDSARALKLQKEVSELRGEMAQKRLEQRLELKKQFPELEGNGFGRGYGNGRGWGMRQDGQERGYGMRQGGRWQGRGGGCRY